MPLADPLNSDAMERIVEDGNIAPLVQRFAEIGNGGDDIVFGDEAPPLLPGTSGSTTFLITAEPGEAQYFSYASMVLPSNDAFVANGNPTAHLLIDEKGKRNKVRIRLTGDNVLDGGTEVNTEGPEDTAFLNQTGPDQGIDENGVVTAHPGFNDAQVDPFPNVLGTPRFANAQFTDNRDLIDITVTARRVQARSGGSLSGDNQVPPVETDASGFAWLRLEQDGDIDVRLRANDIDDLLFAHIHLGSPGENGPVVATLFNGDISKAGKLKFQTDLNASDLTGPFAGMSTADLWQEIKAGNAYVNVHSADFPAGELRANLN